MGAKSTKSITKPYEAHFRAVGCRTYGAYRVWCRTNGFGTAKCKSVAERELEIERYRRTLAEQEPRPFRRVRHGADELLLRDVARGKVEGRFRTLAQHPHLQFVAGLFDTLEHRKHVREAFLRLLLHTGRVADMRSTAGVVPRCGSRFPGGNTLPGALFALAHWHESWRRPLTDWKPTAETGKAQFAELLRYLLCEWHVPGFLDAAWYEGTDETAIEQQNWFVRLGTGTRPQDLELPVTLTRRMAHVAMNDVPATCTATEGWRWAQVVGAGGTVRQAREIVATSLGEFFGDEAFTETMIRFVANHSEINPVQIGPLVDYLLCERNTPREPGDANRLPEGFTLRGRTVAALMERVEAWHREVNRRSAIRHAPASWRGSGRSGFVATEETNHGTVEWEIAERTTAWSLAQEGAAMHHCVATYAHSCATGAVSVWSLTAQSENAEPVRVMTVAVQRNGYISEARGAFNALPGENANNTARLSPDENALLLRGRLVVQTWAEAEGLTLPPYLAGDDA